MVPRKGKGQGWPKALLAQRHEERPPDGVDVTGVVLQHVMLVLSDSGYMERSEPHLVCLAGALRLKEVIATVEPSEGVLLAIEGWEGEFVEVRHANAVRLLFTGSRQDQRLGTQAWNGLWRMRKLDLGDRHG